jgi:hypothetical protein
MISYKVEPSLVRRHLTELANIRRIHTGDLAGYLGQEKLQSIATDVGSAVAGLLLVHEKRYA